MPSKFYLKYAKTNLSHSYVFLDGEFNGGIFKVTRPELDLEMTLKHHCYVFFGCEFNGDTFKATRLDLESPN